MSNILSVRLSDEEYGFLEEYSKATNQSMNKALKTAFFDMVEENYDIELFDKAYAKYVKDSKTYSTKEVCEELGIEI